jgi:hypothetical protein
MPSTRAAAAAGKKQEHAARQQQQQDPEQQQEMYAEAVDRTAAVAYWLYAERLKFASLHTCQQPVGRRILQSTFCTTRGLSFLVAAAAADAAAAVTATCWCFPLTLCVIDAVRSCKMSSQGAAAGF